MAFCSKCGEKLGPEDEFCQKCGSKVKSLKETTNISELKKDKNLIGLPKRVSKKTAWIMFTIIGVIFVIMIFLIYYTSLQTIDGKKVTERQMTEYNICGNGCSVVVDECKNNCYGKDNDAYATCEKQCENSMASCLSRCIRII